MFALFLPAGTLLNKLDRIPVSEIHSHGVSHNLLVPLAVFDLFHTVATL